jgi:hypothetical protein
MCQAIVWLLLSVKDRTQIRDRGMKHDLKTDPAVFDAVVEGKKRFEIRFNDRDFLVGDTVHLMRTKYTGEEMKSGAPLVFTGEAYTAEVSYLLKGPVYGLSDGWCIFGIDNGTCDACEVEKSDD